MIEEAFTMKIFSGYEEEYKKRHDEIWPELSELLLNSGVIRYSIFLDESTNILFAHWLLDDSNEISTLKNNPIMKRWWNYMKDIMETHEDNSLISKSLTQVFNLK